MKNVEFKEELICESKGKQLYDTESYDVAQCLYMAAADGLTLVELEAKENGEKLDNLTRLYDVIFRIVPSFARSNFDKVKDNAKAIRFLKKFKVSHSPTSEQMTDLELYEQWVSFSMQRILFWKGLDGCQTPFYCWEEGSLSRLCINDEFFRVQGGIAYGKALERGLIKPFPSSEVPAMIEDMISLYHGSAFETAETFEQWAILYLRGKGNETAEMPPLVPKLVNLTVKVYERLLASSEGGEVTYDRLLEAVSRVWQSEESILMTTGEIDEKIDFLLEDGASKAEKLRALLSEFESNLQ